ncbi:MULTISPECIES: 3-hydroxyacyl-CoA dehydrogenase NAD-binding domain-containing protein [unclassified Chelatococcus]|uniref:3-hydroxyacyl-CoA dehydrogenase NAD-binding domain-containing protein n=1 Tax=unclassified Chelatococcus TaxID=2638111 RepID=UPI001BCBC26A|nr:MULTISPECIES: 3-hydroxyacyl-CoA dehydrogenase NAD-binding domain-containing protein [unclassified Chelatococcus]MBS7701220.1 enoyl-CoA hydratase/isomerase family protein [Chelatococcus sp. YT9]MBX3557351.1 enoyl-CoA hydratase/isomerase family protein [Chelatococcus sp.]
MSIHASVAVHDGIAVVTLDNPPVNALSFGLRRNLFAALTDLSGAQDVRAIVLTGAGTFIAGADIAELGKPPQTPTVADIIALLESIERPTVAAIHGSALGGGLEVAMACHYRVADAAAKLGLPEVRLGIIPGAGGTQRLPRLVGPLKALDMIVGGRVLDAREAADVGLVDAVSEGNVVHDAIALARARVELGGRHVAVRDREEAIAEAMRDVASFDIACQAALAKKRGMRAPELAAVSIRNALIMPIDEGLAAEREFFLQLVASAESQALRHLFFAERKAGKYDCAGAVREVRKVGVIGAGTMGRGIAMAFLNAGFSVVLAEEGDEALQRGLAAITDSYAGSLRRGSLGQSQAAARLARITGAVGLEALVGCELIIEAVFEDMALKKSIFAALGNIMPAGAVLATNTSWLNVDEIAASSGRPRDVIGLHFFSPANVMKLLEVVRGAETSPDVVASAMAVAKRIGKLPVVVGVGYGFVGNRMLAARAAELESLMLEGAMPAQIDQAFRDFGWPMGPFEMTDLAGLDIGWRNRKAHGKTAPIADALCEAQRFGQKSGRGFHLYPDGARRGAPDPDVEALIRRMADAAGVSQRLVPAGEIIERTHYPLVNTGALVIEEGIARSASDIDVIWVNGYGFPAARGGPMHWAVNVGLPHIVNRLTAYYEATGHEHFKPAALLARLASEGRVWAEGA